MRSARFFFLLLPAGWCAAGFWGCGAAADNAAASGGMGGTSFAVSGSHASGSTSESVSGSGAGGATGAGLAAICKQDSDCGDDLWCLQPTMADAVFGGGAPHGFCTKACVTDATCGLGGVCFANEPGMTGHCTLGCTIGPPITSVAGLVTPLSADKCLARSDVRCVQTGGDAGACVPTCSSDDQCAGAVCDPVRGVCVPSPGDGGLSTGVACNTKASECAGLCVAFDSPPGISICTRPCVLGGASDSSPACGGPQNGLCAFHRDVFGAGDLGYCTLACTAYDDCQNPRFGCFTVPILSPSSTKGYCFAASACKTQSDCGDAGNLVCTPTSVGSLCLESTFGLPDGGFGDAGDAGLVPGDAGDAGSHDDGGPADAGPLDAGPGDGGPMDAGPLDAGPFDAGGSDAGGSDAGATDGGYADAGDGG